MYVSSETFNLDFLFGDYIKMYFFQFIHILMFCVVFVHFQISDQTFSKGGRGVNKLWLKTSF